MSNFLHVGIIFKAGNLNYNESIGNIVSLKKCSIEEKTFSYASRQALRYDIVRIMEEECGYKKANVDNIQKVVQFASDATIDKYPEIDFFGYMKTEKKKTTKSEGEEEQSEGKTKIRKAIVRISDAISLEPFYNEIDFSTNMGLSIRNNLENQIYQTEIHRSYYSYSITVDLDKVGIDDNYKINIEKEEKIKRLKALFYAIKTLNRDIKGKRENLNPLFIIGGFYSSGNPFFYNQLKLKFTKEGVYLNEDIINSILEIKLFDEKKVSEFTKLGYVDGHFKNIDKINIDDNSKLGIEAFFDSINDQIIRMWN